MGWNAGDAEASNVGPNIYGEENVYPFDARGEKIVFTREVCVENPNQIGVNVTCELNERCLVAMRLTHLREEEEDAMAEWCRVLGNGGADVEREREREDLGFLRD